MSKTKKKPRTKAKNALPKPMKPEVPAVVESKERHPHQDLDRAARASIARLTGGVSPHAFIEAWSDWALHLSRSPGRMQELSERAQANALKLTTLESRGKQPAEQPFSPRNYDTRFNHPGWEKSPFQMWQQGFLAVQDWWDYATDPLRGLRQEDADRTRFMTRHRIAVEFPLVEPRDHRRNDENRWPQSGRRGSAFLARLAENCVAGARAGTRRLWDR